MEILDDVIFYKLEKAIKVYRQMAQRELTSAGHSITIDQWLIMKVIEEHEGKKIRPSDIAVKVFKDGASITRILDLLEKAGHIQRTNNPADRRSARISLTKNGKDILKSVRKLVLRNRAHALSGITNKQMSHLENTLTQIIENCLES